MPSYARATLNGHIVEVWVILAGEPVRLGEVERDGDTPELTERERDAILCLALTLHGSSKKAASP